MGTGVGWYRFTSMRRLSSLSPWPVLTSRPSCICICICICNSCGTLTLLSRQRSFWIIPYCGGARLGFGRWWSGTLISSVCGCVASSARWR